MLIFSQGLADEGHGGPSKIHSDSRGTGAQDTGTFWYENTTPTGKATKWSDWHGRTTLNTLNLTIGGTNQGYSFKVRFASS